jgi:hypothetical protein
VTIRIDVDDDGTTDAKIPLKWGMIIATALLSLCGASRLLI